MLSEKFYDVLNLRMKQYPEPEEIQALNSRKNFATTYGTVQRSFFNYKTQSINFYENINFTVLINNGNIVKVRIPI